MSAACAFPVDHQTEWSGELDRILAGWGAMPVAARAAVRTVVESLLCEPDVSAAQAVLLRDLLARRLQPAGVLGRVAG